MMQLIHSLWLYIKRRYPFTRPKRHLLNGDYHKQGDVKHVRWGCPGVRNPVAAAARLACQSRDPMALQRVRPM